MALDDRPYHRDRDRPRLSALGWPLQATVPLGQWVHVRVGVQAWLVAAALIVPLMLSPKIGALGAVTLGVALLAVSALHAAGHYIAALSLGIIRRSAIIAPLGRFNDFSSHESTGAVVWSALGGPLFNLMLCSTSGGLLWVLAPASVPWNPISPDIVHRTAHLDAAEIWLWWTFYISYAMLLLNLLPIYPLDGGHILSALLRSSCTFITAIRFTCLVGLVVSVALGIAGVWSRHGLVIALAVGCMLSCVAQSWSQRVLADDRPEQAEVGGEYDSPVSPPHRRRHISRKTIRRVRKAAIEIRLEQEQLDIILAKVSKSHLASLTWKERRVLRKATERRRRQDCED